MKVMLKLVLDTDPDAAWRALQSPTVFREVSAPLLSARSLEAGGFQTQWPEGANRVAMSALGLIPVGEQVIDIDRTHTQHEGVRIIRDHGHGVSGALKFTTLWDHRMAVSADPAGTGKTLYRDRLLIGAGLMTPAVWASLWAFWQLRGLRMQQLAPGWAFDPELMGPDAAEGAAHRAAYPAGGGDQGRGAGAPGGAPENDSHEAESPAEILAEPPMPDSDVLGIDPDLAAS
ncbi:hypothetical protein [Subtercola vilae]|uniref:hypothetical protein n=1 Tax=Subtercola vilae TaxID=2056433 RepID=UPI00191FC4E5|nr:hypothetical protein [Subtercola vilae]